MELDFASKVDLIWALLPELVLAASGMAVLLAGVWRTGRPREGAAEGEAEDMAPDEQPDPTFLGSLALGGLLLTAVVNGWLYGVDEVGVANMVAVDSFRLFANWLFLLGAALTILVSFPYVTRQRLQVGEFYALILLATVGMMLLGGTRNLILIFLGLETMSVAAYVLTGYNRRDRKSAEAGLKYFLLGSFSSAFLLYGIALTYGAAGTVNLAGIAEAIAAGTSVPILLVAGIGLLAIGFAFKIAAVPFHMWTPDVYEGAPSPSTAFMAAAVKAASFVALVRVFLVAFPEVTEHWFGIMWWLAVLTMVVANLIAVTQANVKRMLAYSSVAHGGYLLIGLVAVNEMASAGILFYLLVYTIMNIGAFGIVMIVANQGEERLQVEDYAGFGWQQPALGVFLTIFLLSLAGFPGTGGFMAKVYLGLGAADAQLWTLLIILVLTTLVSYYYYLRVAWYMWMRPTPEGEEGRAFPVPMPMRFALAGSAAAILFLGIFPGGILDAAFSSVEGLLALEPLASGEAAGPGD